MHSIEHAGLAEVLKSVQDKKTAAILSNINKLQALIADALTVLPTQDMYMTAQIADIAFVELMEAGSIADDGSGELSESMLKAADAHIAAHKDRLWQAGLDTFDSSEYAKIVNSVDRADCAVTLFAVSSIINWEIGNYLLCEVIHAAEDSFGVQHRGFVLLAMLQEYFDGVSVSVKELKDGLVDWSKVTDTSVLENFNSKNELIFAAWQELTTLLTSGEINNGTTH